MATWGANATELDAAAAAVGRAADLLDANRVRLNGHVHHAPWHGLEAERFRYEWDQRHSRLLMGAAMFLRSAETQLRQNATQQREASGSDAGRHLPLSTHPSTTWLRNPAVPMVISAAAIALHDLSVWTNKISPTRYAEIDGGLGLAGELSIGKDVIHAAVADRALEIAPFGVLTALSLAWDGTKLVKHISSDDPTDALFDLGHVALDAAPLAAAVFFPEVALPVALGIGIGTALWDLGTSPEGRKLIGDVGRAADTAIHDVGRAAATAVRTDVQATETAARDVAHGAEKVASAAAQTGDKAVHAVASAPRKAWGFLKRL